MTRPTTACALREAEEFFHERIPLTRAMGLRVLADQVHGFALEAPVALNYNHLHTAFGGSINAVATLAGYGFLWLALDDKSVHLVGRSSSMQYVKPVREYIRAVCLKPPADELAAFEKRLCTKGKARITLQVRVEENGVLAADFEGVFAALKATS
jgi:thioesterase domain-containing protein